MDNTSMTEEDRKYNYWRGFRSACIVLAFPIAGLMWAVSALVTAGLK